MTCGPLPLQSARLSVGASMLRRYGRCCRVPGMLSLKSQALFAVQSLHARAGFVFSFPVVAPFDRPRCYAARYPSHSSPNELQLHRSEQVCESWCPGGLVRTVYPFTAAGAGAAQKSPDSAPTATQ